MKMDEAPVDVEFAAAETVTEFAADEISQVIQVPVLRARFLADRPTPDDWPVNDD